MCGVAQLLGTCAEAMVSAAGRGEALCVEVGVQQLPAVVRAESEGLLRVSDSWVCPAEGNKFTGLRRALQP